MQRRIAALVCACELPGDVREALAGLKARIETQQLANSRVEECLEAEIGPIITQRRSEGEALQIRIGMCLEASAHRLAEASDRICDYFMELALAREKFAAQEAHLDESVQDEWNGELDNLDKESTELEEVFS